MHRGTFATGTALVAIMMGIMHAPAARAQSPKFEVVSIKPCTGRDSAGRGGKAGGAGIRWHPGALEEECQTVSNLIRDAYLAYPEGKPWRIAALGRTGSNGPEQNACTGCGPGLPPVSNRQFHQPLKGSPAWLASDRLTISAKAAGPETMAMMRGPMMQAVLADRFKLKLHRENREIPLYELTLIKGPSKLKAAKAGSCIADATWQPPFLPSRDHPLPASAIECGLPFPSPNGLDFNGTTIANLCVLLSDWADRDVIDRTALAGMFDFHFEVPPPDPPEQNGNAAMFAAMRGALAKFGLKLTAARGQAEFLVIDHVERPSAN